MSQNTAVPAARMMPTAHMGLSKSEIATKLPQRMVRTMSDPMKLFS